MTPRPILSLRTSWRGKPFVLFAALTGLTAFLSSSVAGAQGGNVRIMTQNMFFGNLHKITTATPETLPQAVAEFFNETVATNPKQRASDIAGIIQTNRPQLVALQEVSILRTGTDRNAPATEWCTINSSFCVTRSRDFTRITTL
jgi:hypothetical protein